ncbi:polyprenol phosphomannose-dependent alpha 1,6 mannosyltransferase MptB [Pseudonocardia sp. GCM10023141]|uniref:polyprenol phosphomannose-dependent alpha 1,6 mannosyltransferase MptB n=1 Tax=Pseudonocardia sp. GCM10023141 TaxID=3252653 RepID=UPI00360CD988
MVAPELDGARPSTLQGPPRDPTRIVRRLGLTASLLMAVGALGSGALPVPNPLSGLRILGLPARNATIAIAVTYTGIILMVFCWLWVGKMLRNNGAVAPAPTPMQLARTAITWMIPLAVAPPMFSRDVYSYLAQSAILARGLDPYVLGPAAALGIDDPLVRSIPTIWRDTPAPYGPLFLLMGRGITALSGDNVVLGIFLHRVLALCGIAAIIWALPRLARRCGLDGGLALWLGAANPLVLFHLVSGIHNESLMIGFLLAGMEIGLRAKPRLLDPALLGGAALIVCASLVKLPALLALGFLGLEWARRQGGGLRHIVSVGAVLAAVTAVLYIPISVGTGVGIGWAKTLDTPSLIRSWMSVSTDLGMIGGQVGVLGGIGDHTDAVLDVTRGIGLALAAVLCVILLLRTLRGRLDPVTGMAAGLGAVVIFGPVAHPWYFLWAVIPLAATQGLPQYRRWLLGASAVLALVVPPTGADFNFRAYQLQVAVLAGVVLMIIVLIVQRRRLTGQTGVDIDALPGRGPDQ